MKAFAWRSAALFLLWNVACSSENASSLNQHEPAPIRLSAPVLSLGDGSTADSLTLVRPVGAYRRNNQLFIADAGQHSILVYGLDGSFIQRIGRLGSGPGEFRGIGPALHLRSDSMAILDPLLWRISIFAPDGSYARSVQLTPAEYGAPVAMAEIGDALWVVSRLRGDPRGVGEGQIFRDSLVIRAVTLDGSSSTVVVPAIAGGFWRREVAERYVRVRTVSGSGQPLVGFTGAGPVVNVSHRDEVLMARGGRWDTAFSTNSESFNSTLGDTSVARHWGLVTQDHVVWLAGVDTTRPGFREWRGWDERGLLVARLTAPANFFIWQLGEDWALGRMTDSDGVVRIELRQLIR